MELLQLAQNQLILLKNLKEKLLKEQATPLEGILRLSKSNGTFQYYVEYENKRTYIKKKNLQLAKKLAQREYQAKLIPQISKNIKTLENFTSTYSPSNCENCYSKLPLARRLLISPIFLDNTTYAKQWQAQKFEPNKDFPQGNFFTTRDEHVRSKSEVIIANELNTKGIPYHYEAPLKINSTLTFHPDFLCLNKRTRQEFYWEHCGMMDDFVYSGNLVKRLAIYAQKNIIPGKNLIITMETREQPLNTKDVERVIKAFLE